MCANTDHGRDVVDDDPSLSGERQCRLPSAAANDACLSPLILAVTLAHS